MSTPTPARAAELFARSGFTVYEGGRTMFDSPGMVFLANTGDHWPDLDLFDHEGQRLGLIRLQGRRGMSRKPGPTSILDPTGVEVLHLKPGPNRFARDYSIAGVADAMVSAAANRLTFQANSERYGRVAGRGHLGTYLKIFNHDEIQVGAVHVFRRTSSYSRVTDYVLFIEPSMRGPLRLLLVTVPILLEYARLG